MNNGFYVVSQSEMNIGSCWLFLSFAWGATLAASQSLQTQKPAPRLHRIANLGSPTEPFHDLDNYGKIIIVQKEVFETREAAREHLYKVLIGNFGSDPVCAAWGTDPIPFDIERLVIVGFCKKDGEGIHCDGEDIGVCFEACETSPECHAALTKELAQGCLGPVCSLVHVEIMMAGRRNELVAIDVFNLLTHNDMTPIRGGVISGDLDDLFGGLKSAAIIENRTEGDRINTYDSNVFVILLVTPTAEDDVLQTSPTEGQARNILFNLIHELPSWVANSPARVRRLLIDREIKKSLSFTNDRIEILGTNYKAADSCSVVYGSYGAHVDPKLKQKFLDDSKLGQYLVHVRLIGLHSAIHSYFDFHVSKMTANRAFERLQTRLGDVDLRKRIGTYESVAIVYDALDVEELDYGSLIPSELPEEDFIMSTWAVALCITIPLLFIAVVAGLIWKLKRCICPCYKSGGTQYGFDAEQPTINEELARKTTLSLEVNGQPYLVRQWSRIMSRIEAFLNRMVR